MAPHSTPFRCFSLFFLACVLGDLSRAQDATTTTQPVTPNKQESYASNARFETPLVSLPLAIVNGYPFLEGAINGVKGKLLFDTGEETALAIDTDKVVPPNGLTIGRGMFGSGQSFPIQRFPLVDSLTLPNQLAFTRIRTVRGQSGAQLEHNITQDFLGWIGLGIFDHYLMKLDFGEGTNGTVQFYKNDGMGAARDLALSGEKTFVEVSFDATAHRNLPLIPVRIGDTEWLAYLDTGSHVVLWCTPEVHRQMLQDGSIADERDRVATLRHLKLGDYEVDPAKHVMVLEGQAPVASVLSRSNANILSIGYEVLSQYKTLWDYQKSTLTLLAR